MASTCTAEQPGAVGAVTSSVPELWSADLDALWAACGTRLGATMSAPEHARARAFRFPVHRRRFIAARGALRFLLGQRLGLAPERVAFGHGAHGKPRLRQDGPEFNMSHGGPRLLIALAPTPVGVDVERVTSDLDVAGLAARFFTPGEARAVRYDETAAAQAERFFRLWTLKEAFVKGLGVGLSLPLDAFHVTSPQYDAPAALEAIGGVPEPATAWRLRALAVADGYAAALAARTPEPLPAVVPAELMGVIDA